MRKTKIVCTVGPASEDVQMLSSLMDAGMNVARLNMSHGSYDEQRPRIENIKRLRREKNIPLAIMLDTKGPEVRTGVLKDGKVTLVDGETFVLTSREVEGDQKSVSVTYPALCTHVKAGTRILIDDGLIGLEVIRVEGGTDIVCRVVEGGVLGSKKGVSVPGVDLEIPAISQKDREDILFGIENGIDLIAASFISHASDVMFIRKLLEDNGGENIQIFSKIENRLGVDNFDEILKVSDGIMIARGDLGVEVDMEEVPVLQKAFTRKCNIAGKPVITATQMMDSMMRNPRPTRAEANDVANSIMDGTDAIMLSGETASGKYPLEALNAMRRIANYVEERFSFKRMAQLHDVSETGRSLTNAVSYACYTMAMDLNAAAIITPTRGGFTARLVAKYRPSCHLVATTDNEKTYHQLGVVWGVQPVHMPSAGNTDDMVQSSVDAVRDAGFLSDGDIAIITAGVPTGVSGTTNLIKVHVVGDVLLRGKGVGTTSASGRVCVAHKTSDLGNRFQPGDVLVTSMTTNDMLPMIRKAAAIIVESDDLTCHAAIVGCALDIPVILDGSMTATHKLKDGMSVSVDPNCGYVYNGDMVNR
ncbi:pyruvate kinase [Beduinella massiliensis]|uniref:pyruvate kinase n=1 Tax=Beduinella massiliensis TaxID=1852363 RepID=UPI000C84CE03